MKATVLQSVKGYYQVHQNAQELLHVSEQVLKQHLLTYINMFPEVLVEEHHDFELDIKDQVPKRADDLELSDMKCNASPTRHCVYGTISGVCLFCG